MDCTCQSLYATRDVLLKSEHVCPVRQLCDPMAPENNGAKHIAPLQKVQSRQPKSSSNAEFTQVRGFDKQSSPARL
jgi:hypothetical protein